MESCAAGRFNKYTWCCDARTRALVHMLQSVNDEMCAHIYYYYYYFTFPTINTVGLHTTFTATSPNSQSERTNTHFGGSAKCVRFGQNESTAKWCGRLQQID